MLKLLSSRPLCTRKMLDLVPCSLLLSPLWDAWPPLEGPGVPAEWVEVASSWSRQDAGFWCQEAEEFFHSYHFSHKWGSTCKETERERNKNSFLIVFVEKAVRRCGIRRSYLFSNRSPKEEKMLDEVVVILVYTSVKTNWNRHFKWMHFTIYKFYLNKVDF